MVLTYTHPETRCIIMHNTIHIHPLDKCVHTYIVQSLQYYTSASKLLTRKTSLYNSCLCHLAGYIPLNLRSGTANICNVIVNSGLLCMNYVLC